MNFLQLYLDKWAKDSAPPVEPPTLPEAPPTHRIQQAITPIKIDLEQYAQLTRALRPFDSLLTEADPDQEIIEGSPPSTLEPEAKESGARKAGTIPFDLRPSAPIV